MPLASSSEVVRIFIGGTPNFAHNTEAEFFSLFTVLPPAIPSPRSSWGRFPFKISLELKPIVAASCFTGVVGARAVLTYIGFVLPMASASFGAATRTL